MVHNQAVSLIEVSLSNSARLSSQKATACMCCKECLRGPSSILMGLKSQSSESMWLSSNPWCIHQSHISLLWTSRVSALLGGSVTHGKQRYIHCQYVVLTIVVSSRQKAVGRQGCVQDCMHTCKNFHSFVYLSYVRALRTSESIFVFSCIYIQVITISPNAAPIVSRYRCPRQRYLLGSMCIKQ
jgi:hypothetical protein